MEDIQNVSSTHEDAFASIADPRPALFVHPNTRSPSEIENSDYHPNIHTPRRSQIAIAITIKLADETTPPLTIPSPTSPPLQIYTGILYLVYGAALLYMFPSLIALVGIKFQNKANNPFEADSLFANMAVIAYIIAIPMPFALFCLKACFVRKSHQPIYYRVLQSVFCFWSLLAPLSFVLVLFLPHGLAFIGYLIIFILFVVVVACSFSNYICKEDASNSEAHTRNETLSHSTLIITEE